ncbi:MAG: hypothetical protein ONA69_05710 [candidate division KSB1 bacterium]|nr:hypothetical protein [candidate division KSB1 bacterium]MDZ7346277.1 hypothetical protein [candidate division KSB1 bacterium]
MKKLLSAQVAAGLLVAAFSLLMLLHVLGLRGLVPLELIWGKGIANLPISPLTVEFLSLTVLALFIAVIAARAGWLPSHAPKITAAAVWLLFALLLFHGILDLIDPVLNMPLFLRPFTLILALLTLRLALSEIPSSGQGKNEKNHDGN